MDSIDKKFYSAMIVLLSITALFIYKTFNDYDNYRKALEYQCVDKKLYEKLPSDTYWKPTMNGCLPIEQALKEKNHD